MMKARDSLMGGRREASPQVRHAITSKIRRSLAASVGCLALAVALVLPGQAEAGFTCGGTVGPGGTLVVTTDIGQCPSNPVLTIVGPVTVDMAGHHVECLAGHQAGINIIGTGAIVKNGMVYPGCQQQIVLSGAGHHEVHDMAGHQAGDVSDVGVVSILIVSDHNVLRNSLAALSSGDGIRVAGSFNVVKESYAMLNLGDGVRVLGKSNVLKNNIVSLSVGDAFHLVAGADQ